MSSSAARTWLTATAAFGLVWGQYRIRVAPESGLATAIFCLAALAAAMIAVRRGNPPQHGSEPRLEPLAPSAIKWVLAGLFLLAAGTALLVIDWQHRFAIGWALVCSGTAAASLSLRAAEGDNSERIPWSRCEIASVALALGLGAFLRFHQYDTFPGPYTTHAIEEQQTGLAGMRILSSGTHPWEFPLDTHLTALALWFTSEPTFNTIRVPFTIASWLTILPAHLLMRQLFSVPAALVGTFLFAFSSWNLLYSRCAHNIFLPNLIVVSVFALLIHYARTRRLGTLPWIGLLTGSTLYAYAGYRGTPLYVLGFLASLLIADLVTARRTPNRSKTWRDAGALLIVSVWILLVAAPIVAQLGRGGLENYYLEAAHRALANRDYYTDDTQLFVQQRLQRVVAVARLFQHAGDGAETFNAIGRPMLDPVTAILFVPGLILAILRPRRSYMGFFLAVFALLLAGGTIFVQNLDVRRLQGITIIIAVFAAYFVDHMAWPLTVWRRRAGNTLAVLGVVTVFAWSFQLYHIDMAGDPKVRRAFRDHYTALIQYGREARPERVALLSLIRRFFDPSYHYRANYAWLIDPVLQGQDMGDVHDALSGKFEADTTIVFQEPLEATTSAAVLREVFPEAVCTEYPQPDAPSVAVVACIRTSTGRRRDVQFELLGRYWFGDPQGDPDLVRREPFLGFAIVPKQCTDPTTGAYCSAEWNGTLVVPRDGNYSVRIEWHGRTEVEARLDGQPIGERAIPVRPGTHAFHARARLPRDWETGVRLVLIRDEVAAPALFLTSSQEPAPWPK